MKIGVVGPIWLDIPPKKYGGTEEVVTNLVNGLVEKGHDVTLFAAANSQTKAKLVPTIDMPLISKGIKFDDYSAINYHINHFLQAFSSSTDFDILHVHLNRNYDYASFPFALSSKIPILFTLHYPAPTQTYRPEKYLVLSQFSQFPLTSISNTARSGNDWNFIKTVYNGLTLDEFPFIKIPDNYFAWIGKALPIKGLKEAIQVAKKANVTLKIMAAIDKASPVSVDYFENEVKPLIDGTQIQFLGEADHAMKVEVIGKAKAFLNPLQWPEPFGLVMAESQAVGTPVIALNKGAVNEIIKDKKTGFIVETMDEMVEKIALIDSIHREDCRAYVEKHFSMQSMVTNYVDAYQTVIQNWETYLYKQYQQIKQRENAE